MSVTSISLSISLLDELDEIKDEKVCSSRSKVIGDATRTYISDYESQNLLDGKITSKLRFLYPVFLLRLHYKAL
jgi:metal-responsive CopG/Arc/MetJ family transcriptional regulator